MPRYTAENKWLKLIFAFSAVATSKFWVAYLAHIIFLWASTALDSWYNEGTAYKTRANYRTNTHGVADTASDPRNPLGNPLITSVNLSPPSVHLALLVRCMTLGTPALAYLCAASLQGSLRPLADRDRIERAQFPCFKFWRMVRRKLNFRVPHRTGPRLDFAWNRMTNLFPCPAQLPLFLPIYLGSTILMNHLGPEPLSRALLLGSLTKDTWWFSWGGSWTDFSNRLWILMSHFLSHAAEILLGRDMASTETWNCKIWINVSVLKVVSADDTEG